MMHELLFVLGQKTVKSLSVTSDGTKSSKAEWTMSGLAPSQVLSKQSEQIHSLYGADSRQVSLSFKVL